MMFLFRKNIHLFDICCKIMGKRIKANGYRHCGLVEVLFFAR